MVDDLDLFWIFLIVIPVIVLYIRRISQKKRVKTELIKLENEIKKMEEESKEKGSSENH